MVELARIAPGLKRDPCGYWTVPTAAAISYPHDGNDLYFGVEEDSFWFCHRNRVIVEAVRSLPPAGPVLDVGGGNGYVARGLEEAGFPTVVVEPGPAGAANAVRRGLRSVVCATVEAASFAAASFGGVGLFDVLEHIADDHAFLEALGRLLVPGGRLYLTVPAFTMLWSAEDVEAGHYRRYTARSLAGVLRRAGFTVEYVTYFFWPLPLPIFLCRSLPSLLHRRSAVSADQTRREHSGGRGFVQAVVARCLGAELSRIRRRKKVPLGSSCLAVGRWA
jgi:SAM-dependent methyltransferase